LCRGRSYTQGESRQPGRRKSQKKNKKIPKKGAQYFLRKSRKHAKISKINKQGDKKRKKKSDVEKRLLRPVFKEERPGRNHMKSLKTNRGDFSRFRRPELQPREEREVAKEIQHQPDPKKGERGEGNSLEGKGIV